ncbi:MAG: radical SAM protein [Dictyoglomus turgidum]|nr:MAG: radical SAM protein [Dictyoglomus turgidum]
MISPKEGKCKVCGKESILISSFLGVCRDCILNRFDEALPIIESAHKRARTYFDLSYPAYSQKPYCDICIHKCALDSEKSFCGLVENSIRWAGSSEKGLLEWYYDPLPTNCVATFICPEKEHYGYKNLAIFYASCNFNCLFCQNWHFHDYLKRRSPIYSVEDLIGKIDDKTSCICFFGGDPTTQIAHALALAKKVKDRVRICWETNGSMNLKILKEIFYISVESEGIIKFDLKAFDERIHIALTGVSNKNTLENFRWVGEKSKEIKDRVVVVASTLLIPGYVNEEEVEKIVDFIVNINPNIPYSLLGFAPNFFFDNLPTTSKAHAERSFKLAREKGLKYVNIGNRFLLSHYY